MMTRNEMLRDILLWREARMGGYLVIEGRNEYLVLSAARMLLFRGSAQACWEYVAQRMSDTYTRREKE